MEGEATLFGKRIFLANLSEGQRVLLQLAVAIFLHKGKLDKLILLIDEPENHLHPAALIEVLDIIVSAVKDGQVWIATHNINVLAHFDSSDTWYMEDGKLAYAGNIPDRVLKGLLGNEEEIGKLSNFLLRPQEISFNQFTYQCLIPPAVLTTGIDDKQVQMAHEIFKKNASSGAPLKILDLGMGQGRVLSTIYELDKQAGLKFEDYYDYYGLDISAEYKEKCEALFSEIYPAGGQRYYNDPDKLVAAHNAGSFDYIMMTNVFHEIDPKAWISMLTSPNSVIQLLKPNGILLIIEDQVLPIGEHAHSNGFLVFDDLQFKALFKIESQDGAIHIEHRDNPRLKAHFIPRACISRIDASSRIAAIKSLADTALNKIKSLRSSATPSFQQGRQLGFWTMQLSNAVVSLEELTGVPFLSPGQAPIKTE